MDGDSYRARDQQLSACGQNLEPRRDRWNLAIAGVPSNSERFPEITSECWNADRVCRVFCEKLRSMNDRSFTGAKAMVSRSRVRITLLTSQESDERLDGEHIEDSSVHPSELSRQQPADEPFAPENPQGTGERLLREAPLFLHRKPR